MDIARCTAAEVEPWARLRHALWPEADPAALRREAAEMLDDDGLIAFVARDKTTVIGFAEAALRRDYVNGCETSPVAFLEGLYVGEGHRHRGAARALVAAVEAWARAQGCTEFASDADLANTASHKMHNALGFKETERVVYFKKSL
jgi:aminoglycoside 6'-N-acetyltransferase I